MSAPIPTPPYELRPVTWEIWSGRDYCGTIHRIGSGFCVSHVAARLSGEIEGRTYPQRVDAEAAIWAEVRR